MAKPVEREPDAAFGLAIFSGITGAIMFDKMRGERYGQ